MKITPNEGHAGRLRCSKNWLIILGLISLQGAFSLWHLADLQTVSTGDTAYYYAVAKNIAHGRASPDNVLWSYLGKPPSVEQPAGSYESAGWPYALGLLMRLAGDSQIAALHICGFLSLFLPVLVFLLLERLNCRWWMAAFGAVLVCLQTTLFQAMVTPDVTLSYQLTTAAGFVLFLGVLRNRDRPSLIRLLPSAFVLTLPMWLRGEGFIPLLAATMGILAAPWPWRQRLRMVVGFAALAGICFIPYILYNVHFFGRITPESRSVTPLMTSYKQFYEFGDQPSLAAYYGLGFKGIAGLRIEALMYFAGRLLRGMPYLLLLAGTIGPVLRWITFRRAAGGGATRLNQIVAPPVSGAPSSRQAVVGSPDGCRAAGIVTLWSFVVLSAAVPLLVAPIATNPARFFTNTTPVLCVLAVWTIAPLLRCRWTVNLGILFVAACLLACVRWPFQPSEPWTTTWKGGFLKVPACLSPGNHPTLNSGDIVLTEMPCRLSAQLDVASITAPWDDTIIDESNGAPKYKRLKPGFNRTKTVISAEACRQVIERYHPRFILAEDGSILDQFVNRLKDLPLRVVCRGTGQGGHGGYTWFAVGEGAQ